MKNEYLLNMTECIFLNFWFSSYTTDTESFMNVVAVNYTYEKKNAELLLHNTAFINHNDFASLCVTPCTFTSRDTHITITYIET